MDRAQYQRLAASFSAMCDLGAEQQADRLAQLDAEAPALAAQLRKMLRADRSTAGRVSTAPDRGAAAMLATDLAMEQIPAQIGAFRILGRLGAGGMGVVYEAEQAHPRRRVALKTLHPWLRSPEHLELFRFEAQALGDLGHPGIPVVYAAGEADGYPYVVMELVRGLPLFAAARARGLDVTARLEVLARLCDVVQHAHDAGILHRDLKPQNVILTEEGQPKVLDFGIAMPLLSARVAASTGAVGTLAYASPEQLEGKSTDVRADVYALGVVAYELLTGALPHEVDGLSSAEAAERKRGSAAPVCKVNPAVPADAGWLVDRALSAQPAERSRTAAALGADLRRVARDFPLPGRGGVGYRLGLWGKRNRALVRSAAWAAGLVAAIGLGATGWAMWQEEERQQVALRDLAALDVLLDALVARDAWTEAESLFTAFVSAPDHQETAALSDAWRRQAARRRAAGRPGVLPALGEAWIQRVGEDASLRAGLDLSAALHRVGRYDAAWQVASAIREDDSGTLGDLRFALAFAQRRFADAVQLAPPGEPAAHLAQTFVEARRWGGNAVSATVLTVAGERRVVTLTADDRLELRTLGGASLGSTPHPRGAFVQASSIAAYGNALYMASRVRDTVPPRAALWRAEVGDGVGPWQEVADLGDSGPSGMVVADLGEGPTAWIALSYPVRGLRAVDLGTGVVRVPHPDTDALDSDVTGIAAGDVDGNGKPEIVIGVGDWTAYDVRVLEAAAAGGLRLRARAPLGTVSGLAVVPRTGGAPLLASVKVNKLRNLRVFGADTPYGPAPGVYLHELVGDTLAARGMLEWPLAGTANAETWVGPPLVGDFDGDGRADLAVSCLGFRTSKSRDIAIAADVAGPKARLRMLAGLHLLAAADVDGDGKDELLVGAEDDTVYALGDGNEPLPAVAEPISVGPVSIGPSPGGSRSAAAAWARAQELVALGLPEEAAANLSTLVGVYDDPAVRVGAETAAARLLEGSAKTAEAATAWLAAVKAARPGSEAERQAREGAVRTLALTLRFTEAWAAATGLPEDPARSWIAMAAAAPVIDLLPVGPIDARWTVRRGEALIGDDAGWTVDTMSDEGEILTSSVELQGGRVGLALEADVDIAELGSGFGLELVDPHGDAVMVVSIIAEGGGGLTTLRAQCLGTRVQEVHAFDLAARAAITPIGLQSEWLDGTGLRGCRTTDKDTAEFWVKAPGVVPSGRYTLRLRAGGDPSYSPPTRMRARIRALRIVGAAWPARVGGDAVEAGRRSIAEGEAGKAMALLAAAPGDRVYAALRSGAAATARADVAAILAAGDSATLRRIMRREPTSMPMLVEVLGPAFADLAAQAWQEPFNQYPWREDVRRAAEQPALDHIVPNTPGRARAQLARARVLRNNGDPTRARALAETILAAAFDPRDQESRSMRAGAHLLLAGLDSQLAPERASAHLEAARALEPVGLDAVR